MSRTFKQQKTHETDWKLDDGYVGYKFENSDSPESRKFIKRLVTKHNRKVGKNHLENEILQGIKENIYV